MNKEEYIKKLKKYREIIALCEFGSYGTKDWIRDRSDIDLLVITKPKVTFLDTFEIEDEIKEIAIEFYKYNKIHLTFLLFSDFSNKYSRIAVDSDNKYILDEERWYDFNHYVLKAVRNNEKLEKTLKIDEQYSYFGGIIDESLL